MSPKAGCVGAVAAVGDDPQFASGIKCHAFWLPTRQHNAVCHLCFLRVEDQNATAVAPAVGEEYVAVGHKLLGVAVAVGLWLLCADASHGLHRCWVEYGDKRRVEVRDVCTLGIGHMDVSRIHNLVSRSGCQLSFHLKRLGVDGPDDAAVFDCNVSSPVVERDGLARVAQFAVVGTLEHAVLHLPRLRVVVGKRTVAALIVAFTQDKNAGARVGERFFVVLVAYAVARLKSQGRQHRQQTEPCGRAKAETLLRGSGARLLTAGGRCRTGAIHHATAESRKGWE